MLSMSSDTIESYGSREITHADYGYSRSSTPDSSASSRLAAQLERSAYRRSRSKTRRKQNSKQNDVDCVNAPTRKSSRSKRSKYQERSHSDDYYTNAARMNGTQNPSTGRRVISDEEQPAGNRAMKKPEHYAKDRHFDEHGDGRVLTAQPVSASYTVSCVSNSHGDYARHTVESPLRHSESATDALGRRGQPRVDVTQNGTDGNLLDRTNGFPSSSRKAVSEGHFENKKNRNVNVSRVRFEESWEDSPGKKPEYKVREAPGKAIPVREEIPGYKRSLIQRVGNGDTSNLETNEKNDTSSKNERSIKEKQEKVFVSTVQDEFAKINNHKEDKVYIKDIGTPIREASNRLDSGAQGRLETSRIDEARPLGLRQLIKIHEIQIAEVAKSAASMKRIKSGKAHEGRLVKVKIVPEIETKSPVKPNTAKVTFTGNKTSSDIFTALPRKIPSTEVRNNAEERASEKERLHQNAMASVVKTRTPVRPKRHTVELRKKPHIEEDQKWKRHTAIGLVGFDHHEQEVPHRELSPRGKDAKRLFTSDSDADVEFLRKQPVEPEKQFADEKIQKSDVTDLIASSVNKEMNHLWKESDNEKQCMLENESEANEVPPERPPLPENFYSSNEEIVMRPPPPVYKNDFEHVPKLDFKPSVEYVPTADFTPNVEYIKASPLSETPRPFPLSSSLPAIHVSTAIVQGNGAGILEQENTQEKDHVLGKSRTTREMYEERLARINLVPLDVSERQLTNHEIVASLCSSLESFAWDTSCNHNLNKGEYLDKLKTCMKQMKVLTNQKEDMEKNFELERRDWKRKYEEQQKVANAYQKLEDRYRRQVQELQEALKLCRCTDTESRQALFLGQSWKRTDPYLLTTQTQSILDETEEWLKAQSIRSDITYRSENVSNTRIPNGHSPHDSLTDIVGAKWTMDYKDIALATGIDQYNGTSV